MTEVRGKGGFPTTRLSAVVGARSDDAQVRDRSFGEIVEAYWRPVYKYIRVRWRRDAEESRDLTQEFFARCLEKDFLSGYDPGRARFRTFLRACLDGFLANAARDAAREKRGGGTRVLSLEFELAEGELSRTGLPAPDTVEGYFDAEWVRGLFTLAVAALKEDCERRGRGVPFRLFTRYDLEREPSEKLTYQDLAKETGLTVTQVTNGLALARREFRRLLLERLRAITATDEEYRREARFLLGTDPAPAGGREPE